MRSPDKFLKMLALCVALAFTLFVAMLIFIKLLSEREAASVDYNLEEVDGWGNEMGSVPVSVSIQTGISNTRSLIVWW